MFETNPARQYIAGLQPKYDRLINIIKARGSALVTYETGFGLSNFVINELRFPRQPNLVIIAPKVMHSALQLKDFFPGAELYTPALLYQRRSRVSLDGKYVLMFNTEGWCGRRTTDTRFGIHVGAVKHRRAFRKLLQGVTGRLALHSFREPDNLCGTVDLLKPNTEIVDFTNTFTQLTVKPIQQACWMPDDIKI